MIIIADVEDFILNLKLAESLSVSLLSNYELTTTRSRVYVYLCVQLSTYINNITYQTDRLRGDTQDY
jgi:hypothetical protein